MHHNILRQKQTSGTKIQPSNTFCDIRLQPRDVDNYASPSKCYDCNVVTFKNQKKVLCTPCCHGWPRASRGRLSRFPQIIVGSSLSSPDPHWPDFLPFPAVTLLWRLLQSRLQKTDGDEEIIICRSADGKVQLSRYFWAGPKIENASWGPLIGSSYYLASRLLACEPKIGPRW